MTTLQLTTVPGWGPIRAACLGPCTIAGGKFRLSAGNVILIDQCNSTWLLKSQGKSRAAHAVVRMQDDGWIIIASDPFLEIRLPPSPDHSLDEGHDVSLLPLDVGFDVRRRKMSVLLPPAVRWVAFAKNNRVAYVRGTRHLVVRTLQEAGYRVEV